MICPNCQNDNREGARFCDACGALLPAELASEEASDSGQSPKTAEAPSLKGAASGRPSDETDNDRAQENPDAGASSSETLDTPQAQGADSGEAPDNAQNQGTASAEGEPHAAQGEAETPDADLKGATGAPAPEDDALDRTMRLSALDGLPEITSPAQRSVDPSEITCDLTESLAGANFEAPKPDWHDGGTMKMPVIESAPAESSHDFRASATVEQKHSTRKIAIAIGIIVVAALAIAAIAAYQMEIWGGKNVPDVSGMTQNDATAVLEAKGFTVRATSVKSDDAEGYVLLEDPEANSRQPEGSEVVIHITAPRSMPDVVGKSEDEAKALIAAEDLGNVTYTKVNSDEDEGTVLSSSVDAGTRVKGQTAIELTIAQPYTVPDISGQSLTEAQRSINASGLSYQVVYTYTEQYPDGTILGTTPAAGEKVNSGSLISINVTKTRSAELLSATRSLLASGSTVTIGGISYTVSSLDSVQYLGGNQTSFSMTATPFVSLFGEKLAGTSRSVSGTITWTDDNDVSSISA